MWETEASTGFLKGYKTLPQISVNVPVTDKVGAMSGIDFLADKLRNELKIRLVVRPSGTEPLVRITAEGESEELCALACKIIRSKIEENG